MNYLLEYYGNANVSHVYVFISLKKQTEQQSSCRLHQMLGDFLARTNEHEKALHHFSIALK